MDSVFACGCSMTHQGSNYQVVLSIALQVIRKYLNEVVNRLQYCRSTLALNRRRCVLIESKYGLHSCIYRDEVVFIYKNCRQVCIFFKMDTRFENDYQNSYQSLGVNLLSNAQMKYIEVNVVKSISISQAPQVLEQL